MDKQRQRVLATAFDGVGATDSLIEECVKVTFAIIRKSDPVMTSGSDAYLSSLDEIETDACYLTAMYATVNELCAEAAVAYKEAQADKAGVVRNKRLDLRAKAESLNKKITEKNLEDLALIGDDVEAAHREVQDALRAHSELQALTDSIIQHVNMLKRRVDTLKIERRYP